MAEKGENVGLEQNGIEQILLHFIFRYTQPPLHFFVFFGFFRVTNGWFIKFFLVFEIKKQLVTVIAIILTNEKLRKTFRLS